MKRKLVMTRTTSLLEFMLPMGILRRCLFITETLLWMIVLTTRRIEARRNMSL